MGKAKVPDLHELRTTAGQFRWFWAPLDTCVNNANVMISQMRRKGEC